MHGDVVAAARVLYAVPRPRRGAVIARLLKEAAWADIYRCDRGRVHPMWGDGSLMTAALLRKPPREPGLSDVDYCTCMAMVLEALTAVRI